jgi:hypothetical protein
LVSFFEERTSLVNRKASKKDICALLARLDLSQNWAPNVPKAWDKPDGRSNREVVEQFHSLFVLRVSGLPRRPMSGFKASVLHAAWSESESGSGSLASERSAMAFDAPDQRFDRLEN